ncbi:hypothetical protein E1176_05945 [Fulvivirga sp. RKSG066]|uniref:hypothetical protein n=1 Tax=Fulvivirga aurantia TaxID=2529383 RepID=UPI0012BC464B|nr:hypothetical protein [Fulvivirga aurantia]MTI20555.1 hypothetical protein [Fulvivirga aurantia]
MAVLFHFVFTLFKIAVLASIYALLITSIIRMVTHIKVSKTKLWACSGAVISLALFIYMFTHWGDHGLGDYARIPLNHGKAVQQGDGTWTYITPKDYEHEVLVLNQFTFTDDYLIGTIDDPKVKKYAIWNLSTNEVVFKDSIPQKNFDSQLRDFYSHYKDYWGGWRFWLLA